MLNKCATYMKVFLTVIIFAAFAVEMAPAQLKQIKKPDGKTIPTATIDNTIKQLMDTAEVSGLCLGIINDNKIAYIKTYGYKNKEKNELIDTATCFYAASLSKPLFAYLVMQLVDEGMLSLSKPLYTYLPKPLPEYENYKDLANDERWKLITAAHCLAHTTGFPNLRRFNPRGNQKLEIFFTPGERYAYSGEGMNLLQMVVEIITGKTLEALAQQKVFEPLGMRRTSFLWQPSFEPDYAIGYDLNGDPLKKNKRTKVQAAGSMETTIADYCRFVEAVMQGKGLSPQSKKEMLSPQIAIYTKRQFPSLNNDTTGDNRKIQLSYGLGWGLFNTLYGKAFFKEGHDDGWGHYTIHFPQQKISVIIMTNSSNGESIFKELVEKLTGVTVPWVWESYTPYRATIKLREEELLKYTGVYQGKTTITITMADGRLQASSETEGLNKANLYPQNDHHFFLKAMEMEIDFTKDAYGKFEKLILYNEGKYNELKKTRTSD